MHYVTGRGQLSRTKTSLSAEMGPMPMRGIIVVGRLRQEAVKCLSTDSQQLHLDW